MLTNLRIENVAVIEKASISFEKGLNILTGETGAGKSIVIDSINAVLGERTTKQIVRNGADSAKVTAYFDFIGENVIKVLKELDVEPEDDGSLLINRIITADGRSTCRINGQPVTVSMLRQVGNELISICGQHDSQKLLQAENHITYIDSLGGTDTLLEEYRAIYRKACKVKSELDHLKRNDSDNLQRLDFLKYQIDELERADIQIGEKERLNNEKRKIKDREKITSALYSAHNIISGDENTSGLCDDLYQLSTFLAQLSDYDSEFGEYEKSVDNLRYELEDCLGALNDMMSSYDDEEYDIDSIEERLDIIYRLSKKYGNTEEEMLETLDKLKNEYQSITTSDERAAELEKEYKEISKQLRQTASVLSEKRQAFSADFEKQIMQQLSYLDMPGAVFKVDFNAVEPGINGTDEVQFMLSANAGQEPKPLSKIASGGELSRIMLAIRCALAESESVSTLIFDEIDTGISGRAAHKIGYKLKQLSSGFQVICVTHLAQIAAGADNHLLIEKRTEEGKTFTLVTNLESEERIKEIARIIGGDVITQATLSSAEELIKFFDNP